MGWELFTRQVVRTGEPAVTLGKMGRLAFNMNATALFESKGITHVVLLWDKDNCRCAVKIATSKDAGAYKIIYNDKSNGSGFSAVTFFKFIKYDWTETRAFTAEWDEEEKLLIFAIPAKYIGVKTPIQRADRRKAEPTGSGTA